MTFNAYLIFDGQCEEAMRFYAAATGARIDALMKYEGTPAAAHVPADYGNKVLHARISIDGTSLMASDAGANYKPPQGFSVAIQLSDPAQAERVFQALAEGGEIKMPMQQTFWAARFGSLVDRFGVSWMVNCDPAA